MSHNKIEQGDRNDRHEKPKPRKPRPAGNGWESCPKCYQSGEVDGKTCRACAGRGWIGEQ
jgi:hypothetical protein